MSYRQGDQHWDTYEQHIVSVFLSQQLSYLYISMTDYYSHTSCYIIKILLKTTHTHISTDVYFFSELDCKFDVNEIPFLSTSFIVASLVFCTWKFNTTFQKFVKCTEWPIHRFFFFLIQAIFTYLGDGMVFYALNYLFSYTFIFLTKKITYGMTGKVWGF